MAITIGNTGYTKNATNTNSYDHTHNSNGDLLVAIVEIMDTSEIDKTISATYNGVSMTSRAAITTTTANRFYRVEIFTLASPTAGSNTLNAAISANIVSCIITAFSVSGQDASPIGNTGTNNAGCVISLTTSQANSYIFTGAMQRSAVTPPTLTPEASQTEVTNDNTGSATTEMCGGAWYRAATTVTSYSVGATASDNTGDIAASLEIKAAAAAAFIPKVMMM